MKKILAAGLALCMALTSAVSALAAEKAYPAKPITMIVPYGAGGTTDLVGRQFAIALEKQLGTSITIINQGGASGAIGCKAVLDAKDDGYTVLFTAESLGTQRVMGLSQMSYADFAPIMAVANDPKVIVVDKSSKYNTIEDLIADMKANPNKIKMSYTGPGGSGHIQALIYNKFDLYPALTAYSGGNDCIVAVLGGQVDFTNPNYSTVASYIESGDLKLLAVSSPDPLPAHPDCPTLGSVVEGIDQYMSNPFTPLNFLVDKDVPADIQNTLREAALAASQDADFNAFMDKNCVEKLYEKYTTLDEINEFYQNWESLVSWLLYDAGAAKLSPEQFNIPRP